MLMQSGSFGRSEPSVWIGSSSSTSAISNRCSTRTSTTTTESDPTAASNFEYPRADHQSVPQKPLARSYAATASVALSTNTTGRLRRPFHEYRHEVLHTAPIGFRVYRSALQILLSHDDRVIPLFEYILVWSFCAPSVTDSWMTPFTYLRIRQ